MTKKSNFDPKEWNDLMDFACIGVSYKCSTRNFNSLSGLIGFVREIFSVQTFLTSAKNKYDNLELLREVINEFETNFKDIENMITKNWNNVSNLEEPIARANEILSDKASHEEACAMRAFAYELAFEAANAAGEGFLSTGAKISSAEAEFLQELKRHLTEV